jgi:predicted aspartyl protease
MKRTALLIAASLVPLAPARAEPVEMVNNRPFIAATVNGHRITALLDSAAEMTLVDDDAAARLGLTPTGGAIAHGSGAAAMEARFADHVAVEAVGVGLELRAGILDLGEVSGRLLGRPVEMLLGRDLFDNARLRLDLAGGTIAIADEGEPRGVRLPLGDHRGIPTIPAAVEGHDPVQTVLDTGNGTEVLVGRAYAERIGLTAPGRIVARSEGGGLGGARTRDIVILRTFIIAGRTFTNVRAAIDPGATASDLNIGTSILRHFMLTTDFAGQQVWLEPRE